MNDDKTSELLPAEEQLVTALTEETAEIASMSQGVERDLRIRELATLLVGNSERIQVIAARQCPDLLSAAPFLDTRLDSSEEELASRLSSSDLKIIDEALVSNSLFSWQKASRVIGASMVTLNGQLSEVPLGVYAQRLVQLVEVGTLVAEGDIKFIRLSKVRIAASG